MAVVNELIRAEADGSISFGDHTLAEKQSWRIFSHEGDLYKVKTYQTMTKLEKTACLSMNLFREPVFLSSRRARTA